MPELNDTAKGLLKNLIADDPEIEDRIERGIEANRKGWGEIILQDAQGKPVPAATVKLKFMQHEFQFGCNAFMLEQFPDAEHNAGYQEVFKNLFNLAVVPFYWSDLEPEEGKLRFDKGTPFIYRRPQPELALEFCEKYHITPKGHPLLWHQFWPVWMGKDPHAIRARIRRRFREIAERYADRIKIWDVCNEAQTMDVSRAGNLMPEGHVEYAFDLAAEYFPDCVKTYNDDRMWFLYSRTYTPVYLLMRHLLERQYKVDALGLQFHMFEGLLQYASRYFLNAHTLFDCLDLYGRLNVPVNFSEVSIISRRDLGDGDTFQKLVTEKLYRLWFSHAAVNGIIWWNLVDGTAAYAPIGSEEGENSLRAGLVNYDLTPKPAYTALHQLIHRQWRSDAVVEYAAGGANKFKGFYGDYEATIETAAGTFRHALRLSKNKLNRFVISCDNS